MRTAYNVSKGYTLREAAALRICVGFQTFGRLCRRVAKGRSCRKMRDDLMIWLINAIEAYSPRPEHDKALVCATLDNPWRA